MNDTCTGTTFWVPAPCGLEEGSKFIFLNMVMWHIKLKGMSSRPGYTTTKLTYNQTGDLGMGSKSQFIHSTLNWPIVKSEKLKIEYFRFDI